MCNVKCNVSAFYVDKKGEQSGIHFVIELPYTPHVGMDFFLDDFIFEIGLSQEQIEEIPDELTYVVSNITMKIDGLFLWLDEPKD